jgi:putative serine protease PepD
MSDSDSRQPSGPSTSVNGTDGSPPSGQAGPGAPDGDATTQLSESTHTPDPFAPDRLRESRGPEGDRDGPASGTPTTGPGPAGGPGAGWGAASTPSPGPGAAWGAATTAPPWSQGETRPIPEASGAGPGWGMPSAGSGDRPPRGWRTSRLVAGVLAVVLLIGAGFGLGQLRDRGSSNASAVGSGGPGVPIAVTPSQIKAGDEPVAAVARALLPSVVQLETGQGLGSGVIYPTSDNNAGYILTAAHVVQDAGGRVTVRLADGTKLTGQVVGTDAGTDIGVVKVDRSGLPPAALAAKDAPLQVGQMAVAIGSPFGLEGSVTSGVVSAVNRSLPTGRGNVFEVIQTDAPINPGNSGGALADRNGRVIGINDSIQSESGGNEGVGFAVPIDIAAASATRIVQGKATATGYLGVGGTDPTLGRAGALINEVVSGGPADKAGLQVGDLVVAINGKKVQSMDDLAAQVRLLGAGQRADLTVVRGGKEQSVTATLTNRPNE